MKLFAAPDFSTTPPKSSAPGQDCGSLKVSAIPPLPGAAEEASALVGMLPLATLVTGDKATKAELLATSSPGILHIATHGLFMEAASIPSSSRALLLEGATAETRRPADALRGDPLVRSALLLSAPGSDEGGFATALEIGGMNLEGTQLVVLSACDTARGDVRAGQGVHGLRRAFLLAGARTVVTSLWKVDDEATRDLMVRYYRALLQGEGKADAMRQASVALRRERPHPYYWAPFVVSGDIGRLEGQQGQALAPVPARKGGIEVQPATPVQPIILGPH